MKNGFTGRLGFTLIELLVVVLIIGILAAVAVPQYQVAVRKARLARYIPTVDALYKAQQAYYLANGQYAARFDDLDMEVCSAQCTRYQETASVERCECPEVRWYVRPKNVQVVDKKTNLLFTKYVVNMEGNKANVSYCFASPESTVNNRVCKSLGGKLIDDTGTYNEYELF